MTAPAVITQLPPRRTGKKDADGKELAEAGWFEVTIDTGDSVIRSEPMDPRKISPVRVAQRMRAIAALQDAS